MTRTARQSATTNSSGAGLGWSIWRWGLPALWIAFILVVAQGFVASGTVDARTAYRLVLVDFGPWALLTPLIFWLARRIPIGPGTWRRGLPVHALACVAFLGIGNLVFYVARGRPEPGAAVFPPPPGVLRWPPPDMRLPPQPAAGPGAPPPGFVRAPPFLSLALFILLDAVAHAAAHARRSSERENRALRAEAQLAEARLLAMQSQLQPHFLFNTLNSISSLIYSQPAAADGMICSLSQLLRGVLEIAHEREVTLARELDLIRQYLAIQAIRFEGRLRIRWEIDPAVEQAAVPTLLLQPLVENAFVHGLSSLRQGGEIAVRAWRDATKLHVAIEDNGAGLSPDWTERVGVRNTRERLQTLYHDETQFRLAARSGSGTAALITLPFRKLT